MYGRARARTRDRCDCGDDCVGAGVIASHRWCSGGPAEERYRSKGHGAGWRKWAENRCFWPTGKPRDRALHGVKLTDHWPTTPIDGKNRDFVSGLNEPAMSLAGGLTTAL